MSEQFGEKAQPRALDPAMLDGGYTTPEGVKAWNIGEDGDVLLLGHLDDDTAWAAHVAHQEWMTGDILDESDREVYDIERRRASFSDHNECCEKVGCSCAEDDLCAGCLSGNHNDCDGPCLCSEDYDHDLPAEWPCRCECYCDEYAWWVSTTKSGHEVTWVSFSYEKSRALRETNSSPGEGTR